MVCIIKDRFFDIFDHKIEYIYGRPKYSHIKRFGVKDGLYGGGFYSYDEPENAATVNWQQLINDHNGGGLYDNNISHKNVDI